MQPATHISSRRGHAQVIRNAKLWCDLESAPEAEHLSDLWEWTLVPGFTASKILWLKNNEPENFAQLRQVLLPHDFFNYHLTGRYVMEVGGLACNGSLHVSVLHAAVKRAPGTAQECPSCCVRRHVHLHYYG